jgi:glycerol-3-phosphate dehydrogenase
MEIFDVAIIGGGVVGTAIARELSRYKLAIALLEKEEELAFGVSKSNSGIIHPGIQHPSGSLKGSLCVQGNRLLRGIARELGVDFKEVGELVVAFTKEELKRLHALKKEGRLLGVPRLEIVGQSWLRKHEPNLNKKALAALYAPTAGIISPYRLVYDLAENAVKNGARIFLKTKVENIFWFRHPQAQFKPYFEILSGRRTYQARYVINAAGLYADDISRMVGCCDFTVSARKGEEFILDKKKQYLTNHLIFPLPAKASKGILIIKTADGNPMIGPTAEMVEDKEDLSTTEAGRGKVFESARKLVPSLDENDIIAYFAGLRPVVGDDFIIRHEDEMPGFITIAGIQSPGLTASAAIALMVSGILKKRGLALKKKAVFHKAREKSIHLFAIPFSETKKLIHHDESYGDIVCRCEMVSAKEIKDALSRGAKTLDGIKFRTRAQAGRCHGSFCTTRIMKIISEELKIPLTSVTKRGAGSEIVIKDRAHD